MRLSIGPDRSRFCMEFVKRESGNSYQTAECYLGQTITTWLTYLRYYTILRRHEIQTVRALYAGFTTVLTVASVAASK